MISGTRGLDSVDSSLDLFFSEFEGSKNSVTADRLAILGNSLWLPWRLRSTVLDQLDYSYNTCVFALLWANRYPKRETRQLWYDDGEFLGEWFEGDVKVCTGLWHELEDYDPS